MDPFIVAWIGVGALLLLLLSGVHIGVALGLVGVLGTVYLRGLDSGLSLLTTTTLGVASQWEFTVLPMFVLMGLLAASGKLSGASYDALSKWLWKVKGGLGIATVGACTAFGTVCGSSIVTAAVFAKTSAPEMRRHGYDKRFAYGITSSGGIIGMLIPPSMLAVIYGLLTRESVGKLLIAGIVPGIIVAILFSAYIFAVGVWKPHIAPTPKLEGVTWRERVLGLRHFWPIVVTATVIIGGIYGGVFTPTEAGAVGAIVLLVLAIAWARVAPRQLWGAILPTVEICAMVFLILISALMFSRFLILSGMAPRLIGSVISMGLSPTGLVIAMLIIYFILGCFLDSISMLSITIPVIYPTVIEMGINPIWFAMLMIIAIEAGLLTPPVGLNVYAVKGVAESDVSLEDIFRGSAPFFVLLCLVIVILFFFPTVVTWLPDQIRN